jgi:osmotically-inducible protein OsmY
MSIARRRKSTGKSLLVTLLLAAAAVSPVSQAMAQKKPLGAGAPDAANAKLEEAVRGKLAGDARLRDSAIVVSADVTRNSVTLSGTAPSEAARQRAVELAREAQVGVAVHDRIRIARAGPG